MDALSAAASSVRAPFFFPGHKMGRATPQVLRRQLNLGPRTLRHDLPELPELDNLFAPEGPILRAQELAADAFGAGRTHFLVNGSTAGVLAAVLACVQLWRQRHCGAQAPVVVLPRNVHKSAVNALIAAGAEPCWIVPELDEESGLCLGVSAAAVSAALQQSEGRAAAVLLVSPTYHGVLSDVAACAATCEAAGAPLIVDEAHGAHLSFLPASAPMPSAWARRPRGALHEGAALVVQVMALFVALDRLLTGLPLASGVPLSSAAWESSRPLHD